MHSDPIVDEVRSSRERIARECGFDIDRIIGRIQDSEAELETQGWKFSSPEHTVIK